MNEHRFNENHVLRGTCPCCGGRHPLDSRGRLVVHQRHIGDIFTMEMEWCEGGKRLPLLPEWEDVS